MEPETLLQGAVFIVLSGSCPHLQDMVHYTALPFPAGIICLERHFWKELNPTDSFALVLLLLGQYKGGSTQQV